MCLCPVPVYVRVCVRACACVRSRHNMRVVCRWLKNRLKNRRFSESVCLSSPPALCHYSILILRIAERRAKRESASAWRGVGGGGERVGSGCETRGQGATVGS